MDPKAFDRRWNELAEAVMTGMKEWRLQHPHATFRQIEAALDERLARPLCQDSAGHLLPIV